VLDLSTVPEHLMRETWQPQKLLGEFPRKLTSVDEFIDEQVAAWRRKQRIKAR
jgi:hypothetical protein